MSEYEYTPSTEEVREQYWAASGDPSRGSKSKPEFDRWLAAHDAQVKAEAWDEGFDAGERDAWDVDVTNEKHVCTQNPYRSPDVAG